MSRSIFECAAKINLGLCVKEKRPDGMHEIETVMQSVALFDKLNAESSEGIFVFCDEPAIPGAEANLAYKAVSLALKAAGNTQNKGLNITINKLIPYSAGLGGGSADAACALIAANRILKLNLSKQTVFELAESLGADVPFMLKGGTALCTGTGTIIKQLPALPRYFAAIIKPPGGISTKEAYAALDRKKPKAKCDFTNGLNALINKDTAHIKEFLYNDFEEYAFSVLPECAAIKKELYSLGAFFSLLSGSGSSVYGLFEKEEAASFAALECEKKYGFKAYTAAFCQSAVSELC